jgi:hypothetical protein
VENDSTNWWFGHSDRRGKGGMSGDGLTTSQKTIIRTVRKVGGGGDFPESQQTDVLNERSNLEGAMNFFR